MINAGKNVDKRVLCALLEPQINTATKENSMAVPEKNET